MDRVRIGDRRKASGHMIPRRAFPEQSSMVQVESATGGTPLSAAVVGVAPQPLNRGGS